MRGDKTLYLVIPCYNEEAVLPETAKRLSAILQELIQKEKISPQSKILLANDGSKDKTWDIIKDLHEQNPAFTGIKLSRNRGHQHVLVAGMMTAMAKADMVISLDADLQDDVVAIEAFVDEYHKGCDIVYGVRSRRETDTAFKRTTAEGFYKIMKKMGVDIVDNHADYRLMSRRALQAFSQYQEVNLFLRGIVPQLGFKTAKVYYERQERFAGDSKYPLHKMLKFAWEGITSFSIKPITFIFQMGFTFTLLSILGLLGGLTALILGTAATTLYWLLFSLLLLCGIQLMALSVVGQYVGKTYLEAKARPRYIIEEDLSQNQP